MLPHHDQFDRVHQTLASVRGGEVGGQQRQRSTTLYLVSKVATPRTSMRLLAMSLQVSVSRVGTVHLLASIAFVALLSHVAEHALDKKLNGNIVIVKIGGCGQLQLIVAIGPPLAAKGLHCSHSFSRKNMKQSICSINDDVI